MKFEISRTSFYNNEKPYEKAIEEEYTFIETGNGNGKFLENNPDFLESWKSKGENHTFEGVQLSLEVKKTRWVIEINSLEDLVELQKEHGELVIGSSYNHKDQIPSIEIYDSYRE